MTTAGDAGTQAGMGAHVYLVTRSMEDEYFFNADGEMLFVPQQGALRLWTEFGIIDIEPGEIAVVPRGREDPGRTAGRPARGYLCENYGGAFSLPERGPIGANCLANPRDFLTPDGGLRGPRRALEALCEVGRQSLDDGDRAFAARRRRLARNYAPYKYDLRRYSPSARSCTTTPTRRSSPSSPPRRRRRARPISTSSSSPTAGWWPRTRSAHRGTT
jgi:homogentisate 1,2-dioxygenase